MLWTRMTREACLVEAEPRGIMTTEAEVEEEEVVVVVGERLPAWAEPEGM